MAARPPLVRQGGGVIEIYSATINIEIQTEVVPKEDIRSRVRTSIERKRIERGWCGFTKSAADRSDS